MTGLYIVLGVVVIVFVSVITCKILGSANRADKWTSEEIDKLRRE